MLHENPKNSQISENLHLELRKCSHRSVEKRQTDSALAKTMMFTHVRTEFLIIDVDLKSGNICF